MKCVTCQTYTDNSYRLCDDCRVARLHADLKAQGVPLAPPDETMRRLARLFATRKAAA